MSDPSTRPGALASADARRIAQETADLLKKADNEQEFREYMLVSQAEMRLELRQITAWQVKHEAEDFRQFGEVRQSIGGTLSLKTIVSSVAVATAIVSCIYFIVWLVREVTKVAS